MRYLAVMEKEPDSDYGVYFPDFPGCVTVGDTVGEAQEQAEEALSFHIDSMKEDDLTIPAPSSYEEIMKDPDNRGHVVFEVNVFEKEPVIKLGITSSVHHECYRIR